MVDRYRAPGGWSVQVIHLTATSGNRDGEWLRVSYCGVWVADVRSPGELEQWFPLASLEEEVLVLRAKGHARGSEGWITLSKLFGDNPNRSSLRVAWVACVSSDEVPGYLHPRWRRCF